VPAMHEYLDVWDLVSQVQLCDREDKLIWRWTPDGVYSSMSAYRALQMASHPIPGCKRIWSTWGPLRVKIFLWLAIRGRHWTANSRRRHCLQADDHCYLCDQEPETIDHIITSCSFSRQIWWNILAALGADASRIGGRTLLEWWDRWRSRWHGDKRKGADSLFLVVA
jgi:hypothetical protein